MEFFSFLKSALVSLMPWFPWWQLRAVLADVFSVPVFLVIALCLFLERRQGKGGNRPPGTVLLGVVFLVANLIVFHFLCTHIIDSIRSAYRTVIPGFDLRLIASLPLAWQVVLGLLMEDSLEYGCHRILHRSKWLWYFHEIHHADRHLWPGTAFTGHALNPVLGYMLRAIPLAILGGAPLAILNMRLIGICWSAYQHSDIRGPSLLRYVFATPEFHRLHHSIEERHHNANFGLYFTIWDVLFGTANWNTSNEPMQFGSKDYKLHGVPVTWKNCLPVWLSSQMHPFQRLVTDARCSVASSLRPRGMAVRIP